MSDVFIEMQRHGAYLKVTAIDSETGEEVSTLGPVSDPEAVKRLAIQKLQNKLTTLKSGSVLRSGKYI